MQGEILLFIFLPVFPPLYVSTLGGDAVFSCFLSSNERSVLSIEWSLNSSDSSVNVSTTFSETTRTGRLILHNISENFNATIIQCTVASNPSVAVSSAVAVLLIQGIML